MKKEATFETASAFVTYIFLIVLTVVFSATGQASEEKALDLNADLSQRINSHEIKVTK